MGVVVQGGRCALDAVAGCEIDADNHRHLHACRQKVSKIVFYSLFKILEKDNSLIVTLLGQRQFPFALHQCSEVKVGLSDN